MGSVIPLETVGCYKPDGFRNNLRVGLISTLFLPFRRRGARRSVGLSNWSIGGRRSCRRGPLIAINPRAWNNYYNGLIAGDVAHIGALDHRRRRKSRASIAWARPTIKQNARGIFKRLITAEIRPRGPHLSRSITILRTTFRAFYNASHVASSHASDRDRTAGIYS